MQFEDAKYDGDGDFAYFTDTVPAADPAPD